MPTLQRAELFRRPGPGATLQYLWTRLQNRDLSGAEALAILGALHHELGQSKAQEPSVYSSYSRFMESLDKRMPAVHHYVVATWTENQYTRRRQLLPASSAEAFDDIPAVSPDDGAAPNAPASAIPVLHPVANEEAAAEESKEPGEAR